MTLNRDLALKSLNTLKNKTAELQLASTAPTSEVRFAALVGLLAGVFVALAGDYIGKAPPLRRVA